MRLFFALLPDTATQMEWVYATQPIINTLGGKPQPAANLHLTLHFLGNISADRVGVLSRLGADVAREPIALRFNKIECWSKADLACLRADEEPAALTRLVGHLGTGLQMAGFEVEKQRFKPHVTLARRLKRHEAALPIWPVLEWRAERLALVRSRLSPEGSEYEPIAEWDLADSM
ncbi:MAG: RNA 2',3'-cyclic phosphodiesterase [Gammaproteobacteria bacterium]|nr:RNA 2',3'-cyclic phosphodiesterase [Gammaproteobacteria bacterium]